MSRLPGFRRQPAPGLLTAWAFLLTVWALKNSFPTETRWALVPL